MFGTQVNSEILAAGTTVSFGGRTFSSYDRVRDYRVSGLGQVTDPQTGIVGSSGAEALAKAKAQGMRGAALDSFIDRIGGKR